MKRIAILLLAALFASSVYGNIEPQVMNIHPIVGAWTFPLPNTNCSETYHFYANGTTMVTSGEEVSESVYEISLLPSINGFYKLVDTITKDNGKKDCSGNVMEIGNKATNFIRIHPSGQMLIMCQSESLDACFGPLKRVHE